MDGIFPSGIATAKEPFANKDRQGKTIAWPIAGIVIEDIGAVEIKGADNDKRNCYFHGCQSKNTVKKHLKNLVSLNHLEPHGSGRGTWYSIKTRT